MMEDHELAIKVLDKVEAEIGAIRLHSIPDNPEVMNLLLELYDKAQKVIQRQKRIILNDQM